MKESITLLSTEVIQLFCIVPSFYEYLSANDGLKSVLKLSIGDPNIYEIIQNLLYENSNQNVKFEIVLNNLRNKNIKFFLKKSINQISEELGSFITNLLKLNVRQLMRKKTKQKPNKIMHNSPIDFNSATSSNYVSNLSTDRSSIPDDKMNK